ncbi:MAG: RNA-binding protein [Anaerolineaceae bacterium]|nr:RNA-binding protein [Anaerolineaceae bacterium]
MPYSTTEAQLHEMFGEAGTVVTVDVIKDRESGRPKGFAFVTMGSKEDADQAIEMLNGKEVDGRPLTVNVARPREDRPGGGRPRGGQGGRGGRGGGYGGNRGGRGGGGGSDRRSY